MKKGVNLFGYNRAELGVGESCRLAAASLESKGIPFCIINYPYCSARQNDLRWQHKEVKQPEYNTNVFHINADQMMVGHTHNLIKRAYFENRYNIGVWHWELPEFPDEFGDAFKLVDEIWAPTHFIQKAIEQKSPVPVEYIPHGISSLPVTSSLTREIFNLPSNLFLFLAMYDPCSSQMRKNPLGAIEAYKKAFSNDRNSVGLVIKINNNGLDIKKEIEQLNKHLENYPNIFIINSVMDKVEVTALINNCDAFISLHRSEGFGLSLAEAMMLGKPVIATNWSGNTDFMNINNSCCVSYSLIQVQENWGPYKTHQKWADPDLDEAAFFMRKLVNEKSFYNRIKQTAKDDISNWSSVFSGSLMKKRLSKLNLI